MYACDALINLSVSLCKRNAFNLVKFEESEHIACGYSHTSEGCKLVYLAFSVSIVFLSLSFFQFGFKSRQHTNLCVLSLHSNWYCFSHFRAFQTGCNIVGTETEVKVLFTFRLFCFWVPSCHWCHFHYCRIMLPKLRQVFNEQNENKKQNKTSPLSLLRSSAGSANQITTVSVKREHPNAMCTCFSTSNFLLLLCSSFLHASLSPYPYSLISFRCECMDCRFVSFAGILSFVSNTDGFFRCV